MVKYQKQHTAYSIQHTAYADNASLFFTWKNINLLSPLKISLLFTFSLVLYSHVALAVAVTSWGDVAFSGTLTANELCYTDGTDIICDAGLTVNGTAALDVSGTVSATAFVGDGSGLTGVTATMGINDLTDAKHDTDDFSSLFIGNSAGTNDDGTTNDNVGIGLNALTANTSGFWNVAIGSYSLDANTSGFANIAIGKNALTSNLTGIRNVAIGFGSLGLSTSNDSIAIGYSALGQSTVGIANSAFGGYTLERNTTGSYNAAFGGGALGRIIGSRNIGVGISAGLGVLSSSNINNSSFFGYQSGFAVLTGANDNTFMGYQSGFTVTTGARNILIGSGVDTSAPTVSDELNIGNLIKGSMATGAEQVSITAPMDVSGSVKLSGTGTEVCASTADFGKIRWNPTTEKFQMCRK